MSRARLAAAVAVLAAAAAIFVLTREETAKAPAGAPNIIVVMSDDQALNTFTPKAMPNIQRLLDHGGTRFANSYAIPPLCCPARAGFITGSYPHNHGVVQNRYDLLRDKENTLPVWLDRGGYNVALAGKFMNAYQAEEPAPGFDFWWELRGNPGYYDYEYLEDDELHQAGSDPSDYSVLPVTRESLDFIEAAADDADPFFLWASYYAPHPFNHTEDAVCNHRTAQVLPEDWRLFEDAPVKLPPAARELDISDKPAVSSGLPPLSRAELRGIREDARCSMAAVNRLDDGIGEIEDKLREEGVDDETAIFYISDNGYFFGEHHRPAGKAKPYEGAMRVPMGAYIPPGVLGSKPVAEVDAPTGTIDLAPTILELAGADPCGEDGCRTMDGRSILGLLRGERSGWPAARPLLFELGKDCGRFASALAGSWQYTEWYRGAPPDCELDGRELYDLRRDPHQLENLLGDPATRSRGRVRANKEEMAALLAELRECSGIEGRDETEQPC